jgi:transposase InsO family protein
VSRRALSEEPARAFGRYETSARNERWIGDVLVGPFVPHPRKAGSKRAKLFVLVDDYSRLLVAGRWMSEENTRAGQEVLRAAILRRGVPRQLYMDNGSPYRAGQLARTCAVHGIDVVHSRPYSPEGRGKQERLNRYIRERFLTGPRRPASKASKSSTTADGCGCGWQGTGRRRVRQTGGG